MSATESTTTDQMATEMYPSNPFKTSTDAKEQPGYLTNTKKRFDIYYSNTRAELSHICNMLNITYRGWPYLPDTIGVSNKFYHVMLMLLYNRAYFNAPTSFGVLPTNIPSGISRQVIKMVIGESGFYLKKTTFETGVDFIWIDFGTNIFMVWGVNHRCVYNALSAIKWRVDKYTKIVEMNENNLLLNSDNIHMNMTTVSNDLNIANIANIASVSIPSMDESGNSMCPLIDVGINYLDGIEQHSEIGDNFIYVAHGNTPSAVINATSECELSPIWTKNETNALEIVEGDVPIVINEHEPDTEAIGGDMTGIMSMIMNMLSSNSNKA